MATPVIFNVAIMRPKEVAAYTGLSESRLAKLRMSGEGPQFLKIGKTVLYLRGAIDEWLAQQMRTSTADPVSEVAVPNSADSPSVPAAPVAGSTEAP